MTRRATLLVLAASVLFGTTGTAQALGPHGTDPLVVGAFRLALGGGLLAAFVGRTPDGRAAMARAARRPAGWLCGAAVALYNACFFFGVDRAGVAIGTLVALGTAPFLTGLLGWRLDRARLAPRWWAATALSVAGLALLVASGGEGAGPAVATGALFALGASLGYAVYTALGKRLVDAVGPDPYIAAIFALGALMVAPVMVVAALSGGAGWVGATDGALMIVWLGVAPTAVAYVLFSRGLDHLPAATVSTLTLAEPIVATVLGILVLDERLSAVGYSGLALVAAGLLLLTVTRS